jgi:hypothetical protein
VTSGVIGCPICRAEYEIDNGVVQFGPDPLLGNSSRSDDLTVEEMPDPEVVQALLALDTAGGYVVLVGSATRLGEALAQLVSGTRFIGVNPPPDVRESSNLSLLRSSVTIPIRTGCMRGAVVGREYAEDDWLKEAGRVLMNGRRLVVADEAVDLVGVSRVVSDRGLWVGVRE